MGRSCLDMLQLFRVKLGRCHFLTRFMYVCVLVLAMFQLRMMPVLGQEVGADPVASVWFEEDDDGHDVQHELTQQPPSQNLSLQEPYLLMLPDLNVSEKEALRPLGGDIISGVDRVLPKRGAGLGTWQSTAVGRVWRLQIQSAGAEGLRIQFKKFNVGKGQVWLYNAGGQVEGPYTSKGVHQDGEFWSSIISGDTVTIEYLADIEFNSKDVPFQVTMLNHMSDVGKIFGGSVFKKTEESLASSFEPSEASCHLDLSCYPDWSQEATGVAHIMVKRPDGRSHSCSGALLNDRLGTQTPYFLTAAHCVKTNAMARTVIVRWRHQTSRCNGRSPRLFKALKTEGAKLLAVMKEGLCRTKQVCPSQGGDAALLRLNKKAPKGIGFLGWDARRQLTGSMLTTIHHPDGSFKRISFGALTVHHPSGFFNVLSHTSGISEGGTSGAPIFNQSRQIVGVVSYLISSKKNLCLPHQKVGYMRLSSFYDVVRQYLEGVSVPPLLPKVEPTSKDRTD